MTDLRRVLVVEDDPGTLNLLSQVVQRAGYRSIAARGGKEGWRLLQEHGADLILMDLMMRDLDGWTLLEIIRGDERFSTVPVIIVSARHPREDPARTESYAPMYEEYLVKPFEVDELVAKLAQILQ
jgi:two-component system OmpR family response regulator